MGQKRDIVKGAWGRGHGNKEGTHEEGNIGGIS